MKHFVFFSAFISLLTETLANTYYSQGSLSPNDLQHWNSNRGGGGFAPLSFTTAGDVFVIQTAHAMVTSANWSVGASSSVLEIENGGLLQGDHSIFLSGSFQVDNGATYIHNNIQSVSSASGASIFGGTELFAPSSNFEIRKWINNATALPSVNWGSLVINYQTSIGGNWNQGASLTAVQGDLVIKNTGVTGEDFRLTSNINLFLTIGGNLAVEHGKLILKDNGSPGSFVRVQVNGDVTVTGGVLDLGSVDIKPNNELRFKGNLSILGGTVTAGTEESFLVANGSALQTLTSINTLNSSIKIATGAVIKMSSFLSLGSLKSFIVAGTCHAGIYGINMNGGQLVVSGGVFNSSSKINMADGVCQVCQGNGSFSPTTGWCPASGDTGIINFSTDTILFNRSVASQLQVGSFNSKGKIFLTNDAVVSFTGTATGPLPNRGGVLLTGNGTLYLDENSHIDGDAFYNGNGGWLIIGAPAGILTSGPGGNMQVTGTRIYDNSGINNFEYNSSLPQSTGSGLPTTINGSLKINNSSSSGVTLNNATSIGIGGNLWLANGVIRTNLSFLLSMRRNTTITGGSISSYVEGPLRKIGDQVFTFHVGRSGHYTPLVMDANGIATATDTFTVEYYPGNPEAVYGTAQLQAMDHISSVEYWHIKGPNNSPRKLTFKVTAYSGVNDFASLVMAYYDGYFWLNHGNEGTTGSVTNGTIQITALNYGPFTFGSTNPNTNALPLLLNYFTARKNNNRAMLDWGVLQGMEVDHFEVLYSINEGPFIPVGKIPANGIQTNYQFIHDRLLPGTNYYRLKIVEKNGTASYSRIVAVLFEKTGIEILSAAPSLVCNSTTLTVSASEPGNIQLAIADANGRIVKIVRAVLTEGTNTISVDMSGLAPGIYSMIAITAKGRSKVLRVEKN